MVAVMLVCLPGVALLWGAPAAASVGPPSVVSVTFLDAPTPQPSGTVVPPPGPDEGKPGWVWLAAAGFVGLLGAGAVRFWLVHREADRETHREAHREAGGHWDASAP
jgi:hypothetical protein